MELASAIYVSRGKLDLKSSKVYLMSKEALEYITCDKRTSMNGVQKSQEYPYNLCLIIDI